MIITTMKLNNKQYNYYFRLCACNITTLKVTLKSLILPLSYSKYGIWEDKITTLSPNQTNNVIIQCLCKHIRPYMQLSVILPLTHSH